MWCSMHAYELPDPCWEQVLHMCWVEKNNPDHPDLEQIKERVYSAAKEWKCLKWYREDRKLPNGPYSYKK